MPPWPDSTHHHRWLDAECRRLLGFGARLSLPEGGAAYLDAAGDPDPAQGVHTWITARTAHVYALGALLGVPGSAPIADAALAGLTGRLRDAEHGGWHHGLLADGTPDRDAGKSCYDHAFVLLAASSAVLAERPGAAALLADAAAVYTERFWDEEAGLPVDAWDAAFTRPQDYRGLNATMHSLEALLAVADALEPGDPAAAALWRGRAGRVARFGAELAVRHGGRLPEHFGPDWAPDLELNRDRPDHPFKPFGATPGHGLEWSRLLLHAEAAQAVEPTGAARSGAAHPDAPLRDAAPAAVAQLEAPQAEAVRAEDGAPLRAATLLFDTAVADAWAADGADGFVYTVDWDGRPVVRQRMHWVAAEAIAAAAALHRRTGERRFADHYAAWWDHAERHFIDRERGSWRHELGPDNTPAASVWPGKPDLYHAVQATLLPRLPLAPTLARAVREERWSTAPEGAA